MNDVEGRWK